MDNHCKECINHYNAGHPKDHRLAEKYNDWCCRNGTTAKDAVGRCKLTNMKEVDSR